MRAEVRVLLACLALAACSDDGEDPTPIDRMDGSVPDSGTLDAKVDTDARADGSLGDGGGAGCGLPPAYTFHFDGGLSPSGAWSYKVQGSSLHKTKLPSALSDAGAVTCTVLLGCQVPNVVDGEELGKVFSPADVQAAFSTSNTVLGLDQRSVDGQVLVIEDRDGKKLQIGSPCGSTAGCTPIPANIEALRTTLVKLIDENKPRPASLDGGGGGDRCDQT